MYKSFSPCLLVQQSSNAPELQITEKNLHPGEKFPLEQGNDVILAGGFPSVTPEDGFPLSPALQVNRDVAGMEEDALLALGEAELLRIRTPKIKTYIAEEDKRLCVLGASGSQLQEFVDTYSGVIDIDALLLGGFSRDFDRAEEYTIAPNGLGYTITYSVRSPIDLKKCTYCGECAAVCPENCIDPEVVIDFSRCTFCKECEKSCGDGAIDMHGVVHKKLSTPAILMLDGVSAELPSKKSRIYSQSQLPEFFASLAPFQIDEVVTSNGSICQYNGQHNKGCDLCNTACQHGAISKTEDGIVIDAYQCVDCGACVAVCPTGAIENERFSDKTFTEYIDKLILPQKATAVITNEQGLHEIWWDNRTGSFEQTIFLPYEPLAGLSLFHFCYLLGKGITNIVMYEPASQDLPGASQKQIDLINEFVEGIYGISPLVSRITEVTKLSDAIANSNAIGAIPAQEITTAPFIHRRASLVADLGHLVRQTGAELEVSPNGYIPFATLTCDTSKCTQCLACLNVCQVGAITADEANLSLDHQGAMCVGCGLCKAVCPEDALRLSAEFTLDNDFFTKHTMAAAEPMRCKKCDKVYGTKAAYEKVMSILKSKENVDTSHFEFCEECRVVNLFEME